MHDRINFTMSAIITIASTVFFIVAIVGGMIVNESNAIDSGVIVHKRMDSDGTYYNSDQYGGHLQSIPPSYHFTIEGEKDGKTVQYSFEVSKEEYNQYKIGDYYER